MLAFGPLIFRPFSLSACLQRFVARISSHPELASAPSVRRFVSLQPEAFAAMRDAKRTAGAMVSSAAATAGSSMVRFMKSAAAAVSSTVARARGGSDAAPTGAVPVAGGPAATAAAGGVVPPASGGASAEDLSFGELSAYAENQGPILAALYNSAAAAAAQHRARAQALLEYGASLRALGGSDGGPLGGGLSSAGLALWTASTAAYELAVQESELLVERLADAVRGVRAVKELMAERSRASAALADSLAAVESLRARLTALAASSAAGAGAERAKLENELGGAQTAVTTARARYDTVAASVIAEMERYRALSRGDFRAMLLDFAAARARAAGKVAAAWEGLQPALALMVAQEGGAPLLPGTATAAPAAAAAAAPAVGGAGAAAGISAF